MYIWVKNTFPTGDNKRSDTWTSRCKSLSRTCTKVDFNRDADTGKASVDTKMVIDTIRSRNFQLEKSSTTRSFSSLSPAFSNSPAISFN